MTKVTILFWFVILLTISLDSYAANDNRQTGARSEGMGNASVGLSDAWSSFNNQAGLAMLPELSVAISYHNAFLIKNLGINSICAILPGRIGTFSINYAGAGSSIIREHKAGLSYSKKFGPAFSAGLQFSYVMMEFPEEGKLKGVLLPEGGIIYQIAPEWNLGVHLFNPFQQGYHLVSGDDKIPTIFKVGCSGNIHNDFTLSFEVEKDLRFDAIIKAGMEYRVRETFFFRGGFNHRPGIFSLGFGYQKSQIKADLAFSHHGNLGYSPTVSIAYQFRK